MPFNHIKLAVYMPLVTASNSYTMGQRYSVICGSGQLPSAYDYTQVLSANPNCKIFSYISGSCTYKSAIPFSAYKSWKWFQEFLATNPTFSREEFFLHYREDKLTGYLGRASNTLVDGYGIGILPGTIGLATSSSNGRHSRMINQMWGAKQDLRVNITGISRTSGLSLINTGLTLTGFNSSGTDVHTLLVDNKVFETDDRIHIEGCPDSSFNGDWDICTTPSFCQIGFSQALPDVSFTSVSNVTASQHSWTEVNMFYDGGLAREWYLSEGKVRYCQDAGGNKLDGFYYDNLLNYAIYSSGSQDHEWTKCLEWYNASSPSDYKSWIYTSIVNFTEYINNGLASWRGAPCYIACNGDGPSYIYNNRSFYERSDGPSYILIESGFTPDGLNSPSLLELRWPVLWGLMDTWGKKLIWQGYSNASLGTKYHDSSIIWVEYEPHIFYTDTFSFSKTPITYYSSGDGALNYPVSSLSSITNSRFYWDSSIGRLFAYSVVGSGPTGVQGGWGIEPFMFCTLNNFYVFGNHTNGFYNHHDNGNYYGLDPLLSKNWWPALAYNIGDPTTGGVISDGLTIATDLWGISTATSTRGYIWWNTVLSANTSTIYARKYSYGYTLFRCLATYPTQYSGSDPVTFTMPFSFQVLRGDGTLDPETNEFTLGQGEGVILITNASEGGMSMAVGDEITITLQSSTTELSGGIQQRSASDVKALSSWVTERKPASKPAIHREVTTADSSITEAGTSVDVGNSMHCAVYVDGSPSGGYVEVALALYDAATPKGYLGLTEYNTFTLDPGLITNASEYACPRYIYDTAGASYVRAIARTVSGSFHVRVVPL